jgi:eukaryotic-like serine/threonine-protein kinase
MGLVYLAHDPKIDRKVAIKTIQRNPALPDTEAEESKQRFLREAQAAGKLIHPGIVTIFDVGEDQGLSYIAMEFIEGQTLESATKPGGLMPVEKAVMMMIQACLALDYAHKHLIVHRDIKPANLMIVADRHLKVTDFGLAKNPSANLTSAGTLIGTPNYMSPEQIMGKALDGRSDIFSLGVVLYELLTGERPFGGDTISTIIYRILHEVPKTPETINPRVPAAVTSVILKALEKDPAKRFQSGEEMAAALQAYLDSVMPTPRSAHFRVSQVDAAPPPTTAFPSAATPMPTPAAPPAEAGRAQAPSPAARPAAVRPSARPVARPAAPPKRRSMALPILLVILAGAGAGAGYVFRGDIARWLGASGAGSAKQQAAAATETPISAHPEVKPPAPEPIHLPPIEAPAPLPAGDVVSIRVETKPPGGRIFLDEREVTGGTVVLRKDDTQAHSLVGVSECLEGRMPVRATGSDAAVITLQTPRLQRVRVTTEPPGGAIVLDGRDTKLAAPADISVAACEPHSISARLGGFKEAGRKFDAKTEWAGQGPIALRLEKLPDGFINVKSPYPVEILESDRSLGTSASPVKLAAGRHTLSFVNRDLFVEVSGEVEVEPEGSVSPKIDFPGTGQLTVLANPGDGTVIINGRKIGSLPFIGHALAEGTYTLRYALDSGRGEERTIYIIAGQPKTEKFILN